MRIDKKRRGWDTPHIMFNVADGKWEVLYKRRTGYWRIVDALEFVETLNS